MNRLVLGIAGLLTVLNIQLAPGFAQSMQPNGNQPYGYTSTYASRFPALAQLAAGSNNTYHAVQSPQAILNNLKQANQIPSEITPKITITDSDTLNASTDGSGITITSALLNRLQTNDQRAFVISHELSHVVLNHIARTQARHVGLSLVDALLLRRYVAQGSLLDLATNLGFQLYDKRSSRVYEYQADDAGIQLMRKAGYNPQAAIEVFGVLKAGAPSNQTPEFLQDHPITDSRIRALAQKYKLSGN